MSIHIVELTLDKGISLYKCVGNQHRLEDYMSAHPPRVSGDWSALYTQLNCPHSLGTVGYRWDAGYETANVLHVSIAAPIQCIIADAPFFVDGSKSGEEKATLLRDALELPGDVPLMNAIGEQGKVLVCRETETQWEMVLPHTLGVIEMLGTAEQHVVMQLKPNQYGATGHAREWVGEDFGPWRRYDEDEALRAVPEPAWVCSALGRPLEQYGST